MEYWPKVGRQSTFMKVIMFNSNYRPVKSHDFVVRLAVLTKSNGVTERAQNPHGKLTF